MKSFISMTLIAALAVAISSQLAHAFSFSPIMSVFAPSGDEATKTFTSENQGDEKIAVQVSAFVRTIDDQGKETLSPSMDFKIFPEQFTLDPKRSRSVRVTYRGVSSLTKEASYRIIAEQLPVDLKAPKKNDPKNQMKFLVRYATAIYVTPPTAEPSVKVEAKKVSLPEGERLQLTLVNEGNAHQVLSPATLELKSKKGMATLDGEKLKSFDKQNLLAGGKRVFVLPWPSEISNESIEVKISFK